MRKVLVCVRSITAAQNITAVAARLGLSAAVRTAVSEPEVMLRLSERSAEIVLADTALARPDSASFTRRVLARSPGSVIVLFGAEDSQVASAAMAAGARGLIRGADDRGADDLVTVVAKTLLLLAAPGRAVPLLAERQVAVPCSVQTAEVALAPAVPPVTPSAGRPSTAGPQAAGQSAGGRSVPNQRDDTPPAPVPGEAAPDDSPASVLRRIGLTERELQVLRGMAEGKSNGEIGRELFVSEDTVKTHARRLFRKLGARDRAHAVATGFRSGLVA
ncbi:LuxR C-terminal-related transcriptional regulator [Solwaraspora sp. WMMB335]|uniref:helix-turn-helix transcriptional regulator n=1 Tax=Solwaraspora sp. WMMB335 TaxID=3404118 RepID=UPI003B96449A